MLIFLDGYAKLRLLAATSKIINNSTTCSVHTFRVQKKKAIYGENGAQDKVTT